MTNKDSLKRLWVEYNKLKNWAESTNPIEFTIESSSFDESEEASSSAAANENVVTITGLIYPTTESFTEWTLRIEIDVPITYPQKALEVYMKTNIRHPNIDKNGKIWCTFLESLKSWESFSLSNVVTAVTKVMDRPESSHIADAEMYTLYETNSTEYNRKMKEILTKYGIRRSQSGRNTEKSNMTTHENLSIYSNKKLGCKGRACAKCGNCRDWYWHTEGDYKAYTKRTDASCTARESAYRCRYYSFFTGGRYVYWHYNVKNDQTFDVIHMCECEDNQG